MIVEHFPAFVYALIAIRAVFAFQPPRPALALARVRP